MGIRMSLMKRSKIEAYRSIFNYNPNYGKSCIQRRLPSTAQQLYVSVPGVIYDVPNI
jgi:hypothetical protein